MEGTAWEMRWAPDGGAVQGVPALPGFAGAGMGGEHAGGVVQQEESAVVLVGAAGEQDAVNSCEGQLEGQVSVDPKGGPQELAEGPRPCGLGAQRSDHAEGIQQGGDDGSHGDHRNRTPNDYFLFGTSRSGGLGGGCLGGLGG